MVPTEAIEEVARLKGLFPGITQDQEDFWFERFKEYPRPAVRRAVDELAKDSGDFVDRPRLLGLIRQKVGGAGAEARAEAARQEAAAKAERIRRETEAAAKEAAEVERLAGDLGETGYRESVAGALAQLPESSREFFARRDPARNPVLKAVVYQTLKQ